MWFATAAACALVGLMGSEQTERDRFAARARDWRQGAVVYQVFVDRFAPSADLDAKRKILLSPRTIKPWTETPKPSTYNPQTGWPHTLEFWGGDLNSVRSKLDYVSGLHADVLYLTPIFKAYSNHKYDTEDYLQIDPGFGSAKDLRDLIGAVHSRKMRIVLDGVFNHMGRTSPAFQSALKDTASPYHDWFVFGKEHPNGYRAYADIREMPALNLESPAVAQYLWKGNNSVVRRYLREGIDGWRLDVAYDIGPDILSAIRAAAHETKPGSTVVGEISGYPAHWFDAVDGVFNFHSMQVAIGMLNGEISGGRAGRTLERAIDDAGTENLLRSWLQIDNHDTDRAADIVPDPAKRRIAQALLFTLPGSPVIYYGSELGMSGTGDPQNRAPMRWDLATDDNRDLAWVRRLLTVRSTHPALRYGDFRAMETDRLLAFTRTTDRLSDLVLTVVNPTTDTVTETFAVREGRLQSWGSITDLLGTDTIPVKMGLLRVTMPPQSVRLYAPVVRSDGRYSPFFRIP